MEVVVNDTNIFIDLYSIGCLDAFFSLPITIHTVDFVINEIKDEQQLRAVERFIISKQLVVRNFSSEELGDIVLLHARANGNVSMTDCAVWYYAKSYGYVLLTGDRQLRNKAVESNVDVRGILHIFDMFMLYEIFTPEKVVEKLKELQRLNPRLPHRLIQERVEKWSKSKHM